MIRELMFDVPGGGSTGTNIAEPVNFNDLFMGSLFEIPEYQRGYSWENRHLEKFLQDIRTIVSNYDDGIDSSGTFDPDRENIEHHNFGTVQSGVSKKVNPTSGRADDRVAIVRVSDGQQRLVTTLLFLRALAERIADEYADPDPLDGLKKNFIASYKELDAHDQPTGSPKDIQRLTLNHSKFNNCLKDLILAGVHSETTPTPVTKMKEALEWFKDALQEDHLPSCRELLETILKRSELVLLRNKNSLEFMVFEARNNRGRQVSELDKVKNLIQLIEHRGHITGGLDFPKIWFNSLIDLDEPGIGLSEEIHENRILSYALSLGVLRNEIKNIGASYTHFHDKFWALTEKPHTLKEKQLKTFVSTFVDVVKAYRQLRRSDITLPRFTQNSTPQKRGLKSAKEALYSIKLTNRIGILEPILIAAYLTIDEDKLGDFAHVCQQAERALFRVYIAPGDSAARGSGGKRVDHKKKEIFQQAHDIYKIGSREGTEKSRKIDGNYIDCLPSRSRQSPNNSLPHLKPDEHAIHFLCDLTLNESGKTLKVLLDDLINSRNAYNPGQVKWGRYVIFQYEKSVNTALSWSTQHSQFAGGKDTRDFHAEHIMPKNPRIEKGKGGTQIKNYWLRGGPPKQFNSEVEREGYLHRLGNLVLSSFDRNQWYENHPYRRSAQEPAGTGDKRTMYRDRRKHGGDFYKVYEVERYYKEWDQHTIQHRQKLIAIWAVDRWKMDCSCDKGIKENEWPTMYRIPQLTDEFQNDFGNQLWFSDEEPEHGELAAEIEVDQPEEDELADYDETLATEDGQEPDDPHPTDEADGPTQEVELEIPDPTNRNVWVEKTKTMDNGKEILHRTSGPRALGRAIWSPRESKSGQDIYAEMRDVSKGDLIIHLVNNSTKDTYISGVSVVKNDGVIEEDGITGSDWEGPAYLHELQEYIELSSPIYRPNILSEENRAVMDEIRQDSKVFYTANMKLRQGHYLTLCVPKLADLIDQICVEVNNSPLPHFDNQQTLVSNSSIPAVVQVDAESVKAAETQYGSQANFGPVWPGDQLVFGSERPGYETKSDVPQTRVKSWIGLMKAHGIRRVVCLLHPKGKLKLYDHIEGGLEGQYNSKFDPENVLMVPIIDRDISSEDQIKNIVDFLDESERLELPVVVHCSMGYGRTGHVLAVWRNYRHGVNRNKALGQTSWGGASRGPKEALGYKSKHLESIIDITDYYDLMDAVRKDEEE